MQQQIVKELRDSLRNYSTWASQLVSLPTTADQEQSIRSSLQDMEDSELRVALSITEKLRDRFF